MITSDFAKIYEVVGRAKELEALHSDIQNEAISLIQITGAIGVGKTAIANRLYETAKSGGLGDRFAHCIWISAYQDNWGKVMSQVAGVLLGTIVLFKATREEIEGRIIAFCAENKVLLIVDHLDGDAQTDFLDFINKWMDKTQKSLMIITSRNLIFTSSRRMRNHEIMGLADPHTQLQLIGQNLGERFKEKDLTKSIEPLRGNPLNLLYLRYLDPKTIQLLNKHVLGLIEGTIDRLSELKLSALEDILGSFHRPPTHFMALAVIRNLEFNEHLLAFFWDAMGGGNSEAYIDLREALISSGLLIPISEQQNRKYRISEDIHVQLYRALSNRIGGDKRISTVHFFASEYYRRIFESKQSGFLDALLSFVYHSFASGDFQRAYSYVFETDTLVSIHQEGLALQIKELLEFFIDKQDKFNNVQNTKILLQLAHACNDLSEFEKCLSLMNKALQLMSGRETEIDKTTESILLRSIWYYSAVAYSNTGHSTQCLRSYFKIISTGWEGDPEADPLTCLSLAYLAHDLKYRNISLAIKYGEESLRIARNIEDSSLIAKCLCSLAESLTYVQKNNEAHNYFREAEELCSQNPNRMSDRRELGRILKNLGLLNLIQRKWKPAEEMLLKAKDLSSSISDRRRVATADLYLAVLFYHHKSHRKAELVMVSAIEALFSLGDGRYLIPAIMTYVWWKNPKYTGKLTELSRYTEDIPIPKVTAENLPSENRFEVYAQFWRDYFKPVVLSL